MLTYIFSKHWFAVVWFSFLSCFSFSFYLLDIRCSIRSIRNINFCIYLCIFYLKNDIKKSYAYRGPFSGLLKNTLVVHLFVYNSFKLLQLFDVVAKLTANGESKWSRCNVRISFNLELNIRQALVKVRKLVSLPDNVLTVTFNL